MFENALGKVMPGLETAPAAPEEDATEVQKGQYEKESRRFDEITGSFLRECFELRLMAVKDMLVVLPLKSYKRTPW